MLNQLSDTQLTVAMSLFPDPNPEIVRQALDRPEGQAA
jgi:hypothetical protein